MTVSAHTVVYVLRSFPRLSQTFIVDEVRAIERHGAHVEIFAITDPGEQLTQPDVRHVRARVRYLDRAVRHRRARLRAHAGAALRSPRRYTRAVRETLAARTAEDGYHVASNWRCLQYAAALAGVLRKDEGDGGSSSRHLHAHFAHDPALVALLTHHLTGIPFTFTAHARDIFQVPSAALAPRIRQADAVVTCCRANVAYLSGVEGAGSTPIEVVRNGLDLSTFPPADRGRLPAVVAEDAPPLILSVGRLVEKKGFDDLLAACAEMSRKGRSFRLRIDGDGPLSDHLEATAERLGLGGVVEFTGALPRPRIIEDYRRATVFALTPFVTGDGDRDGLPTVLVEAMASGLPVVTTAVAGIPELVTHGVNGLVGPPRSVPDIARHLETVLGDAALSHRLGTAARETVEREFDARVSAAHLSNLFGQRPGPSPSSDGASWESRWIRSG